MNIFEDNVQVMLEELLSIELTLFNKDLIGTFSTYDTILDVVEVGWRVLLCKPTTATVSPLLGPLWFLGSSVTTEAGTRRPCCISCYTTDPTPSSFTDAFPVPTACSEPVHTSFSESEVSEAGHLPQWSSRIEL